MLSIVVAIKVFNVLMVSEWSAIVLFSADVRIGSEEERSKARADAQAGPKNCGCWSRIVVR